MKREEQTTWGTKGGLKGTRDRQGPDIRGFGPGFDGANVGSWNIGFMQICAKSLSGCCDELMPF